MKIISVVAARPNFIKVAPFIRAIQNYNADNNNIIDHILVHTGQHYDSNMSDSFFVQLGIPKPNYNLGVGSGSHAKQDGETMIVFENVLENEKPDWIVVFGDVNATMSCTIIAKKMNIKVCHIEAGIRSGDMTMPEEINRIVTDSIADLLLTPDEISIQNLLNEGKSSEKIEIVGNIMIDSLDFSLPEAKKKNVEQIVKANLLEKQTEKIFHENNYSLITMHRPSNVDYKENLYAFISWLKSKANINLSIIWILHPRTKKMLEKFDLFDELITLKNVMVLDSMSYIDLICLNIHAKFCITDSGGLQEECCVIGTPFFVPRTSTERPLTLVENGGTGILIGNNYSKINDYLTVGVSSNKKEFRPKFWDGNTAKRCLDAILKQKD
jgi:UDP-N-acetylglucosamine 2-epimerase (non-hydrolysing)